MELETVGATSQQPVTTEPPPEADRRALVRVRRWLEDAWRHGEIVADDDTLETRAPSQPANRFAVSRPTDEATEPTIN